MESMRVLGVALVVVVGGWLAPPPASTAPAAEDARLGCWSAESGEFTLLLEPGRAGLIDGDLPRFFRAAYAADGVTLESWGRELAFQLELDGARMHLMGSDRDLWMQRVERVPELLLVAPYELPEDFEVDADLVADLTADLLRRRAEDQRVRRDLESGDDPSMMQRVDSDNTEFLRNLIGELGWIDAVRFGAEASDAAFLIVQHTSDLRLMRTALPRIEQDVRAGHINGQNYALLFDRLQLNLGYLQRYGSQIGVLDGEHLLMPCEDLARVDELRAELGMGPLGEYLAYFREEGEPAIRHLGQGTYGE